MPARILVAAGALAFVSLASCQRTAETETKASKGAQRAILAKPAVVLIYSGAKGRFTLRLPKAEPETYPVSYLFWGSGFFISPNGYVATNAHVVEPTREPQQDVMDSLFQAYVTEVAEQHNVTLDDNDIASIRKYSSVDTVEFINKVYIADGTAFPFEIKQYGAPVGETSDKGKDVAILKIEVKNAPTLKLGNSDDVELQDEVTAIGYPGAANSELLDRKSRLEASITNGTISAKKTSTSGAPILQFSAPATHGSSGGPVLNDANEVVGVATFLGDQVSGQEVEGFTFAVPVNTVKEYIPSGAVVAEGPTDKAWREGLELYWNHEYTPALAKFEEVKRLFPQHSDVDRLIQSSQQAKAEGKEHAATGRVSPMVYYIVAAIILIGLGLFFARRRRSEVEVLPYDGTPGGTQAQSAASNPQLTSPGSYSPLTSGGVSSAVGGNNTRAPGVSTPPVSGELAGTVGIPPGSDRHWGFIKFVSGALAGQQFDVNPDGEFIGRDSSSSEIVIDDPRISKRHLWIGVKYGRVVVEDRGSRNGAFINDPKSARVTEAPLSPGDTVILGESEVARFEYQP